MRHTKRTATYTSNNQQTLDQSSATKFDQQPQVIDQDQGKGDDRYDVEGEFGYVAVSILIRHPAVALVAQKAAYMTIKDSPSGMGFAVLTGAW